MATGNVVHNLERFNPSMSGAYDWGERFDGYIRGALEGNDRAALVGYEGHPDAALAAPDRDHFLPILYIAGIRSSDEPLSWVVDGGLDLGAVSMRAFRVG
jgi:4,5-DOPA dioxygenase extradiol